MEKGGVMAREDAEANCTSSLGCKGVQMEAKGEGMLARLYPSIRKGKTDKIFSSVSA